LEHSDLCGKVISFVGFPVEAQTAFDVKEPIENKGISQRFVGGALYYIDNWFFDHKKVSFGKLNIEYEKNSGIYGNLGAPAKNLAISSEKDNPIYQSYEGGKRIDWYLGTDKVNPPAEDDFIKLPIVGDIFNNSEDEAEFIEGVSDALAEYSIFSIFTDLVSGIAISELVTEATRLLAGKKAKTLVVAKIIPGIGWAIAAYSVYNSVEENWPLYKYCTAEGYFPEGKRPVYYCGKLGIHFIVVGLGATGNSLAGKLNKIGVLTATAREAKKKLFSRIGKATQKGEELIKLLIKYDKTRNTFFKELNESVIKDIDESIANADLDKIINEPELAERLIKFDVGQRKWDLFHSLLKKRSFLNKTSAEAVNKTFDPKYWPPYKPRTEVKLFKYTEKIEPWTLGRLYYFKDENNNNLAGQFYARLIDIIDPKTGKYFSGEYLQRKFALTYIPNKVVSVEPIVNLETYEGLTHHRPEDNWTGGDVIQYHFDYDKEYLDSLGIFRDPKDL